MSVPESELSNLQDLYRKHVHDNLMLHDHKRQLDTDKRNVLKELKHSKYTFLNKYAKHGDRRRTCSGPISRRCTNKETSAVRNPRPRFLICKNLPYSFKSWNDLVDVSKDGDLDIYKTEVLKSKVGESLDDSENNKANGVLPPRDLAIGQREKCDAYKYTSKSAKVTKSADRHLKTYSNVETSEQSETIRLEATVSPRLLRRRCETQTMLNFRKVKQAKFPAIRNDGDDASNSVAVQKTEIPIIEINSCVVDAEQPVNDEARQGRINTPRRSLSMGSPAHPNDALVHRKRSNTIDYSIGPNVLSQARRKKESIDLDSIKFLSSLKGLQKLNNMSSLLYSSSDADAVMDDSEQLKRSMEVLQECRYLRSPTVKLVDGD